MHISATILKLFTESLQKNSKRNNILSEQENLSERSLFLFAFEFNINFESFFLEPYTKDFGRITHFLGNDLVTVLSAAFCPELRSWQLILNTKITKKWILKKDRLIILTCPF